MTQPEDVSTNQLFAKLHLTVVPHTNVTQPTEFVKLLDHLVMTTTLVPLILMLMELDAKTYQNANPTTCVSSHLVTRLTELANLPTRTVMMVTHVLLTLVTQLPESVSTLLKLALAQQVTLLLVTLPMVNVSSFQVAELPMIVKVANVIHKEDASFQDRKSVV